MLTIFLGKLLLKYNIYDLKQKWGSALDFDFCDGKTDIIVFGNGAGWFNSLFENIKDEPYFHIGSNYFSPFQNGKIFNCINRMIFGNRFGNKERTDYIARLLINNMCKKIGDLFPNRAIFIINRTNYLAHNTYFLETLKSMNKNFVLVYWFTDIVAALEIDVPSIITICRKYYDHVITYEKKDAIKYNFNYIETPYSIYPIRRGEKTDIDLLYIGKAKLDIDPTRYKKLIAIFEAAKKKKLNTYFSIVDVPYELQKYPDDIVYNKNIPYSEVLSKISRCKCILEVSQKGENGTTLRMFEAIAYNKKLLFTNSEMTEHQYYDDRIMKLLEEDSNGEYDIDIEFINRNEEKNETLISLLSPYRFVSAVEDVVRGARNE